MESCNLYLTLYNIRVWEIMKCFEEELAMSNIIILTANEPADSGCAQLAQWVRQGVLEAGNQVQIVDVAGLEIKGCEGGDGCECCWLDGTPCVQRDSMDDLWDALEHADGIAICSPLYTGGLSTGIINLIDRLHPYLKRDAPKKLTIQRSALLLLDMQGTATARKAQSFYEDVVMYMRWKNCGQLLVQGQALHRSPKDWEDKIVSLGKSL